MLTTEQTTQLLATVKQRFENNKHRHENIEWSVIEEKLRAQPAKLAALYAMEETGGEPDIVVLDEERDGYVFCDCSKESPTGRRSICYDDAALQARKNNRPENSAINMAQSMGVEILTEKQYKALQMIEPVDLKTSSWIFTPPAIRALDGALFCDRRYDHVFVYHNGASSYYAARGFRSWLGI